MEKLIDMKRLLLVSIDLSSVVWMCKMMLIGRQGSANQPFIGDIKDFVFAYIRIRSHWKVLNTMIW